MKQYFPTGRRDCGKPVKRPGYVRPERVNKWPNSMTDMMMIIIIMTTTTTMMIMMMMTTTLLTERGKWQRDAHKTSTYRSYKYCSKNVCSDKVVGRILSWKVGRCNPHNHSASYRSRKETENWVTSDGPISQDYMQNVCEECSKRKIYITDTELV